MATFAELKVSISTITQKSATVEKLDTRINDAVSIIAAGVRMPNGQISPPLPDLYSSGTVSTATDAAFKSLPATYQRHVFYVVDSNGDELRPPSGGDYYSFRLFLNRITKKDLSGSGSIIHVAVKGSSLYYQGIPTASEDLTVHFYRLPVDMDEDDDTPDGIPDHLSSRLIKHFVSAEIFGAEYFGEDIQKDTLRNTRIVYHEREFYRAMQELIDFVGDADVEPVFYRSGSDSVDLGVCD